MIVKSGCSTAFTFNITFVVWVRLPLFAVMVSEELPTGVVLEVETLNIDEPEPLTETVLKFAVAPEGNPLTLSATLLLKPTPLEDL